MSRAEHAKHQNIEAATKGDPIKEGPPPVNQRVLNGSKIKKTESCRCTKDEAA